MQTSINCDICGGAPIEYVDGELVNKLEIDTDGLWICSACQAKVSSKTNVLTEEEPGEALDILVGKQAGWICTTLNLPYRAPFKDVIDHASKIQDMLMSPWTFMTLRTNGESVWRSPGGDEVAVMNCNEDVRIEQI